MEAADIIGLLALALGALGAIIAGIFRAGNAGPRGVPSYRASIDELKRDIDASQNGIGDATRAVDASKSLALGIDDEARASAEAVSRASAAIDSSAAIVDSIERAIDASIDKNRSALDILRGARGRD